MIKKVIIFIIIIVAAVVIYNQFQGSSGSKSPQEQTIERLSNDLHRLRRQFDEANKAAALSGTDISADIDRAYSGVNRIETELAQIKYRLTSESAKRKAEKLQSEIDAFKRNLK